MRQRSTSLSGDYDFPRTTLVNDDSCSCQIMSNRNNLNSVKKCCSNNDKLSSLDTNHQNIKNCCDNNKNVSDKLSNNVKMSSLESLPSVPSFDLSMKSSSKIEVDAPSYDSLRPKPLGVEVRALHTQYSNVFLDKDRSHRDSIPEEIAPPPPILKDNPEEHYKIVGSPIPVNSAF